MMNEKLQTLALASVTVMAMVYIASEIRSMKERKSLYRSIDTLEKRVWEEQE